MDGAGQITEGITREEHIQAMDIGKVMGLHTDRQIFMELPEIQTIQMTGTK